MPTTFDIGFCRAQFPALETDWALFDNAGGSVPARHVIEHVTEHLTRRPVQLGATYGPSREAALAVGAGRASAATLFGCDPEEIVFGASSTALVGLLARALRPGWKEGDEVIVTNLDHEANIGPWRRLEESGIVLREWTFRTEDGELHLEDLEPLLNDRTRLVAFTHCSNLFGTIHDVPAFTARIRAHGALSCVDGVAYAPHRRVDGPALGADFYFASLYKIYGPHLGVMYGRRSALRGLRNQSHFFVGEDQITSKLEPGNPSYELAAGVRGIVEYLGALESHHGGDGFEGRGIDDVWERIARREEQLVQPLLAFLDAHPQVKVLGRSAPNREGRVPTVSFTVEGVSSSEIPRRLDELGIGMRYGHFYSLRAVQALGLPEDEGVCRVSLLHYNTEDEVRRLLVGLEQAISA